MAGKPCSHLLLLAALPIMGLVAFIFQLWAALAGKDSNLALASRLLALATAITLTGTFLANILTTCACCTGYTKTDKGCNPQACSIVSLVFMWITFALGITLDTLLWILTIPLYISGSPYFSAYAVTIAIVGGLLYAIACGLATLYVYIFFAYSPKEPPSTTMKVLPTAKPPTPAEVPEELDPPPPAEQAPKEPVPAPMALPPPVVKA